MLENNPQKTRGASNGRILIFILILTAVIILVAAGIYYGLKQAKQMSEVIGRPEGNGAAALDHLADGATSTTDPIRQLAEKSGRPALGNPNAGLVIVEFADFECPVCQEEFYQIREFVNRHQAEVYYIYRHYPVKGNNSIYLAQAAMCADEQDRFWQLHDKLFLSQGQIESEEAVTEAARQSGADLIKFQQCLRADQYRTLIFEDMNDAISLGAQGTPTFFVNGSKLEGVVKLADWERILQKYKEISSGN